MTPTMGVDSSKVNCLRWVPEGCSIHIPWKRSMSSIQDDFTSTRHVGWVHEIWP